MEILQAIILGVIEGLTEFLPISSTGHLIVAADLMDYHDTSRLFTVVIQTGAILAVIWFYRRQLWALIKGLFRGNSTARRFFAVWILATIPAGIVGLFFETNLEHSSVPLTVAIAMILGGLFIWWFETYMHPRPSGDRPEMEKIGPIQALTVGFYQILSLVPGVSRSGATILGGMLAGMDRLTATAFSFYMGIPILLIAGAYKLSTGDIALVEGGGAAIIAGMIASFITAFIAVGWLLKYVSHHDLKIFAYYRIIFGLFLLVLIGIGVLG